MKEHASRNPALQAKKKGGFFNKKGPGTFFGPSASPTPFFPGHSNESPGPEPGGATNAEPAAVQTKLTVGEPNDNYEKEADATADKVVQRLSAGDDKVQRKCADCEANDKANEKLQTKPIFDSKADPMDEPVRRKEASSATPAVTPSVESGLRSSKGGGSQLPASTRKQMESGIGADFSGVRIHNDGNARQMSKDLNAQAFTHGKDIYFNSGKYDPSASGGQHLLAHELTHVVQQGGGSIKRKPASASAPATATTPAPAPAPAATIQRDPDPNSPGTPPNPGGGSSPGTPDPNSAQGQSTIPGPPYVKDGYTFKPDTKELRLPLLSLPTIKQDHGQDALWTFPRKLKADRDDDQTTVWTGDVTTATTAAVTTYLTDKDKTDGDNIYFLKGISTNFTLFGTADQIQQNSIVPKWDRKGGPRNHDIDHIVEMQLDGAPAATNLQLLDASANRSSGSKLHWEIIKRIKAGLKYFNDAKVPNVPADTDIIGADPPTYNVFFEATDGFKLPTGGDGSMYWTRDEIKAATHLQQLKGMTLAEIKKIQGSATELVLFVRAGGGTPHTFSIPASAQPLVPGVDVTAVNLTNQAAAAGQQMGNIQVTLKPSLQKKLGLKDPVTINFNKVPGLANAGTLDLTGVDKSLAYKLRFTGLSPITINNFDLGDEGLLISGIITADVPLIKDSPIDFSVQGEDIRISKTFNSGEIKGFPKPFIVNDVSLSIFASTEFGFGVEGDINFAIQGLGKGSVTGVGATTGGFGVKGEFAFDSKKFQGSKINFSYLQQQWTIGGTLIIPPGSGIKGVDSANMTVQYAAEKITADGSVKLTVPGIDKATLHAEFADSGAFTVGGSVDLKALPGIKSGGKVTAQISKAAGGADYSLSITGEVEPNLPNVPKLNPKLTVSYIDGLFKAEGKMDFGTSGGMITGDVTVGVTNGTVADGVLQGGEGGKNISVYGKGTLHFIPFKGVDASITVKVNTDGKALFSFSLDTKVTPFDPIEKTIPILDVSQDIPLVGVPFLSLNLHIGFHARLDIKWLPLTIGVKASMTDKSYDDLVGGKFDSDFALTVETSGSVALVIGVEAGVSVTVAVFVGGATLNGDVTLQANAALKGELDAGWGGEKGLLLKGGKGTAQADLQLIFGLSGRAFVDVDLLFTKKNVWEKKWDLAKSDPKTLYSLGIEAPFEFDDNNNLKPFDPKQIKFNPPLDSDTANKQGNSAVNPDGANQAQKPDDEKVKNDLRQEIKTEMRDAGKDKSRDMDAFAADLTTKLTASSDASLAGFVKQTVQDELNAIKAENASSSSPNDPSSVSRKPMNGSPDVIQLQGAGGGTPPPAGNAKESNPSAKASGGASPAKSEKGHGKPDFNLKLLMTLPNDDPKPDYSKGTKQLGVWEHADLHFDVKRFVLCDSIQKSGKESSFVTDIGFELTNPVFIFEIANEISRGMTGSLDVGEFPGVTDPTSKETRIIFHQVNQRIVNHSKQHFAQYRQVVMDAEKEIRKKLAELPGKTKPKKMAKKDLESFVNSTFDYLIADLKLKLYEKSCQHEKDDYGAMLKGINGIFATFVVNCGPKPKQLAEPLLVTVPGKDTPVKKEKPAVRRMPLAITQNAESQNLISRQTRYDINNPSANVEPVGKKIGYKEYVDKYATPIAYWLRDALHEMNFEIPIPNVTWTGGSSQQFTTDLWAPVLNKTNEIYLILSQMIEPDKLELPIEAGRNAIAGEGTDEWNPGVITEVKKMLARRLIMALNRVIPLYVQVMNEKQRENEEALKCGPVEPGHNDIHPNHPLEQYVIPALKGKLTVDFVQFRKTFKEGYPPQKKEKQLRAVKLEFEADKGALNWVKAIDPADATKEEVAQELYGTTTKAWTLSGNPPYFAMPHRDVGRDQSLYTLKPQYEEIYQKIAAENEKASPDAPVPSPTQTGAMADDLALSQASGVKPSNATKAEILQRMGLMQQLLESSARTFKNNPDLRGMLNVLLDLYTTIAKRLERLAKAPEAEVKKWDAQSIGQLELIRSAYEGIHMASEQMFKSRSLEAAKLPISRLADDYIEVFRNSDYYDLGKEALDWANDQSKIFPATVAENILASVRHDIEEAKKDKTEVLDPAVRETIYGIKGLEEDESKIREEVVQLRSMLLQGKSEEAAKLLDQINLELQDIRVSSTIVANMDQVDRLWKEMLDNFSVAGAVRSIWGGGNKNLSKIMADGRDISSEWASIYREWQFGDKEDAQKRLLAESQDPKWQNYFKEVADGIEDQQLWDKWMNLAFMIGITIVSGGLADLAGGIAAEAWGVAGLSARASLVSWRAWAVTGITATTDATVYTALSTAILEKDPTLSGFLKSFGENLELFGILRSVSKGYYAALGVENMAAITKGQKLGEMVLNFATVNAINLKKADTEQYDRTGQHLSWDQITDLSFNNLCFTVAIAIGGKLAEPAMQKIIGGAGLKGGMALLQQREEQLHESTRKVEAAHGNDPRSNEEMRQRSEDLLDAEEKQLKDLQKVAADPKLAKAAGIDESTGAKIQEDLAGLQLTVVKAHLEPVATGEFMCTSEMLTKAKEAYESQPRTTVKETTNASTNARTLLITDPEGTIQITERFTASKQDVVTPVEPAKDPATQDPTAKDPTAPPPAKLKLSFQQQLDEILKLNPGGEKPPRLKDVLNKLKQRNIPEDTILAIVRNAVVHADKSTNLYFGDLNTFLGKRGPKLGAKGFDAIIDGLTGRDESNYRVAKFLMERVSNGQWMGIKSVLNTFTFEDIAGLRSEFPGYPDADMAMNLAKLSTKVDATSKDILQLLRDAGKGKAAMENLIEAVDRLGQRGKFTPDNVRESLKYRQRVRDVLSDVTQTDQIAELLFGEAAKQKEGEKYKVAKAFTKNKSGDMAAAFFGTRKSAIASELIGGDTGHSWSPTKFAAMEGVIRSTDLPDIVKNAIIGELWAYPRIRILENIGFKMTREVHFRWRLEDGSWSTRFMKLDGVGIRGDEAIYAEFKSSADAETSEGQDQVIPRLQAGDLHELQPFGPGAEEAFGGKDMPNFKPGSVTVDRPGGSKYTAPPPKKSK
jgi:hypothetical protein